MKMLCKTLVGVALLFSLNQVVAKDCNFWENCHLTQPIDIANPAANNNVSMPSTNNVSANELWNKNTHPPKSLRINNVNYNCKGYLVSKNYDWLMTQEGSETNRLICQRQDNLSTLVIFAPKD